MTRRLLLPLLFVLASCASDPADDRRADGGDGGSGAVGAAGDGGGGAAGSAGAGGAGGLAGSGGSLPPLVPYGLDERPSNPTCLAGARPSEPNPEVVLEPAFPSLSFDEPLALLQAPGNATRFYVLERGGRALTFTADSATPEVFADLRSIVEAGPGEAGLLGMAFDPAFEKNGRVIVSYTAPGRGDSPILSVIARFRSKDGGLTLDLSTEERLIELDQPYGNHNGGNITFGPDGLLYIGFGDGGSGGDPQNRAQNRDVLFGKILRIDVSGAASYEIPPTNPFAKGGGRPEIFALGLRNPWRFTFDRDTGELWAGDVGQNAFEEIDKIELGGNYGWNVREAHRCYNASTCESEGFIDPIAWYGREQGQSVTGGYVYRGAAIPMLQGAYLYGDFSTGRIWGLFFDSASGGLKPRVLLSSGLNISSFAQDAAGEVYVVDFVGGGIHKFAQTGDEGGTGAFPRLLSKTGCVEPTNAKRPIGALIPYTVNAPFWSDGVEKDRYFAIPDGKTITVREDGDWDLPIGTVTFKNFHIGDRFVETRLFVRHDDGGWAGYSYEWNDEQTDATLLPAGKTKEIEGVTWTYPSRGECLACHTNAAGGTLAIESAQLHRNAIWPNGRHAPQLGTYEKLGLFDAPLEDHPALAEPFGDAPLEDRARSYLHANCSGCHRPGGPVGASVDFRYSIPFADQGVCDAPPQTGDLGIDGAKLIVPGDPEHSLVYVRMSTRNARSMPPLATKIPDEKGARLLKDFILSLQGCP